MSYDIRTKHTQNVYIMSNHPVQYDRGFIEAIVSLAPQLQAHAFLDNREREKSAFGQPKEYTDGYISGLNILSSFLDKHRTVPRYVYDRIQSEIDFRQAILSHTPKFKDYGKETPQEELNKTPITPQSVDASKGYETYCAFADAHPSMVGGPLLPKLEPGTDGSRSNKPVGDEATGGFKPEVNSAIEDLAKATKVPVHLVKGPKDFTSDDVNIATHNFDITPDGYIPFRSRLLNYILISGNFGDYHVGDQVIINEVTLPHFRKTGNHLHVLIKEVHSIGDKVLLLFDMSGDF